MTIRNSKTAPVNVRRGQEAGRVKVSIAQAIVPPLPHERDESAGDKAVEQRKIVKQAAADLKCGLTDTDRGPQMGKVYKNV